MWKILLVDDEPRDHAVLSIMLPPEFQLVSCYTGGEALESIPRENPDLVLLDVKLPDINGIEVLKSMKFTSESPVFIMVSGFDDTDLVVESIKAGAQDYLVKPYTLDSLLSTVKDSLIGSGAKGGTRAPWITAVSELVGDSSAMRKIKQQILSYAPSDGTVLITGESGTGKEIVARAIHRFSSRGSESFRAVNCGAIPETLFESELFGSVRGAFTGAVDRQGILKFCDGGTLLLDEIGELTKGTQVKLLRVIEEKKVRQLGSSKSFEVDVRIIASTNQDLKTAVDKGLFRGDLYYRLNVFRIRIPPLRERKDDLPLLSYYFLKEFGQRDGNERFLTNPSLKKLFGYTWPGNVRELRNVIERACYLCPKDGIDAEYIQFE